MTNESNEEIEATTVVINPSSPVNVVAVNFYRENVSELCGWEDGEECSNKSVYVHPEDADDTLCTIHRMEISPRRRREFVKISDVPSNKPTSDELLAEAFGDDEDLSPADFAINE